MLTIGQELAWRKISVSTSDRAAIQRAKASWQIAAGNYVAFIATLMASLSFIRVIIDIYQLSISVFLTNVLKTYVVVFHTMFNVAFFWLPLAVPPTVKDGVISYLLLGSATCAAEWVAVQADLRHPWLIMHNFKSSKPRFWLFGILRLFLATVGWPLWVWQHHNAPHLVWPLGAHGPGRARFMSTITAGDRSIAYICDARLVIIFRLACILASAATILVFNYAFSI